MEILHRVLIEDTLSHKFQAFLVCIYTADRVDGATRIHRHTSVLMSANHCVDEPGPVGRVSASFHLT